MESHICDHLSMAHHILCPVLLVYLDLFCFFKTLLLFQSSIMYCKCYAKEIGLQSLIPYEKLFQDNKG